MRSYPVAGTIQVFAALTPVSPGHEPLLRAALRSRSADSPFARVPGTHFARWVVVTKLPYDGPRQKPDLLRSTYLLFSACFDGADLGAYLERLRVGLGSVADEVWGQCVGYGGESDLVRYLTHNRIDPAVVFAEYPTATVAAVKDALALRSRLQRFVIGHQRLDHRLAEDAATLRKAWRAAFGSVREEGGDS
jgi:hypothetical protein